MAEDTNPAPTGDINPTGSGEQPPQQGSDIKPTEKPQEQPESVRKLQSDRDKAKANEQSLEERLSAVEQRDAIALRDTAIGDFLKENSKDYPDVEADDLEFATSPEEIKVLADRAQAKADKIRNKAMQDVQQVPETVMTAEEKAEALKTLEETAKTTGQSQFGKFLDLQAKQVKG
jgi:hypothetical protein